MDSCPLDVTPKEAAIIAKSEAVVIREYERSDLSRIAKLIAWGDLEEMEDLANRSEIVILPVGITIIAQKCVPVAELLGPEKEEGKD